MTMNTVVTFIDNFSTIELVMGACSSVILFVFISIYSSHEDPGPDSGCGCCIVTFLIIASIIDMFYLFGKVCFILLLR